MIDLLGYGAFFTSTALIFGLITLGLNLQWGLTGLFNVGIAGFVAIGAYSSAILTTPDAADRVGGFGWPNLGGRIARHGYRSVDQCVLRRHGWRHWPGGLDLSAPPLARHRTHARAPLKGLQGLWGGPAARPPPMQRQQQAHQVPDGCRRSTLFCW